MDSPNGMENMTTGTNESIGPDPDKPRAAVGDFGCFHARPTGCDALGDLYRRLAG
jgi:hypothetical protein